MRVLLVGEYSRLHNSLKEGLENLGHNVILIGRGDGFKNFPVDINIESVYFSSGILFFLKRVIYRLFKIDLIGVERGIRFYLAISKFKRFDIVQLINEEPIKSTPKLESFLLKKILKKTKQMYLLSCGIDYTSVSYALDKKLRYSILTPFFNKDDTNVSSYKFVFRYVGETHKKLHDFLFENIDGVIASDMDYHIPLEGTKKYVGMIPNPINDKEINFVPLLIEGKIKIFHGINIGNYYRKGNYLFEKALRIIEKKYPERIEVISTQDLPYEEYINIYNSCHILLDQVYSYDQGYNALEAMAKGKVVFTGAEKEFLDYYGLEKNEVCINALPDVDSLVAELENLIQNPEEIIRIGENARKFVEKKHNYIKVAQSYLNAWDV